MPPTNQLSHIATEPASTDKPPSDTNERVYQENTAKPSYHVPIGVVVLLCCLEF